MTSHGITHGSRRRDSSRPPRIILFFDMNSYFATVEQQANPFLRGRSVGVCAYLSDRGCIIASSREAKQKGITTGIRVIEAKRLDPNVALIECRPAKYRATTSRFMKIVTEYSEDVEPYSIDEVFCDLTGAARDMHEAVKIGNEIRRRIKNEVGQQLTCSMGIATTRWIAKFIADVETSGDLAVVQSSADLLPYLARHRLTDAWGINVRMERRLNRLGIWTLLELRHADPRRLKSILGLPGYLLWAHVNGIEASGILKPALPKHIGHSYALPKGNEDIEFLDHVLMKLASRVGRKLRGKSLEAKGAYVSWSSRVGRGGGIFKRSHPFHRTDEFLEPLRKVLRQRYDGRYVYRVDVGLFGIVPTSGQLSLFPLTGDKRRERLSRTIDRIWDRYGDFSIVRAPLLDMGNYAVDRIGFRKTVKTESSDPLPLTVVRE